MEVQLYVYDLTRGMARAMSQQFLGIQIDAVYHTALVFGGIEHFFGAGVQTSYPGATHHGQPMEIVPMGVTHLPQDTIAEYLDSLKQVYTAESYDLFAHNCNNFTNDFAMFLVGTGIPVHITNLPKRVLDTPFGQMLKPQLDASMRSVIQAAVPPQSRPSNASGTASSRNGSTAAGNEGPGRTAGAYGTVINVSNLQDLDKHLHSATSTAATIFFTSSTCAPCKLAYPTYDSLAATYAQAIFLKVDINNARDVAARYQVRATPTFLTSSKGTKVDEWSGANPSLLKANVAKLLHQTFPPHRHTLLKVPTLQYGSMKPVTFVKVPPLEKLAGKLGEHGKDPSLLALRNFVQKRQSDPRNATVPDLRTFEETFQAKVLTLPVEVRFAAFDLLRCALLDPRVSTFLAEESHMQTVSSLLSHVVELAACPHNLRLVTLHLACNLFTSPACVGKIFGTDGQVAGLLVRLITSALLDASHPTTRVASASLAFNLAVANYRVRREEGREALSEELQVELAASLLESLAEEANADASKAMLLAVGYLLYCAPTGGEVMDLCQAMDAKAVMQKVELHKAIASEVALLL